MIIRHIAIGIIEKNVNRQPKNWTIVPPIASPNTEPPANMELIIP